MGLDRSCEVLGISRSAFYEWLGGKSLWLNAKKAATKGKIVALFWEHKRRYGARPIRADLSDTEHKAGRAQIRNRLREAGMKAIQPRSFVPKTTQTNPNLARSPNLLLEMDKIEQPNPGLIIHSDGGGQCMEKGFRAQFATGAMIQSMTRPDNHYDNAFAESMFSRFKAELSPDWPFKNVEDGHIKTFEYIEGYYNRKRRHSSLSYLSPQAFENRWIQINNVKE